MIRKVLVFLFLVTLLFFFNLIIPPFQNPDEPQHFAAITGFAQNGSPINPPHSEIIRLMDRNNFWRFLGMGKLNPLPEKLESIAFLMSESNVKNYTERLHDVFLYYFVLGKLFGPFLKLDVIHAYYGARIISFLLFISTLSIIYFVSKNLYRSWPSDSEKSLGKSGLLFVLFLPQYIFYSFAVNPDCFTILLGTAFFGAAFFLIQQGKKRFGFFSILFFTAVLGALIDRQNLVLIPLCFLTLLLCIDKNNYRKIVSLIFLFLMGIILVFFIMKRIFPDEIGKGILFAKLSIINNITSKISVFSLHPLNRSFLLNLVDSFFLRFGWWAYASDSIFFLIWRAVITLSSFGIILALIKSIFLRKINLGKSVFGSPCPTKLLDHAHSASKRSRFTVLSLSAVIIQVLALRMASSPGNMLAHGRYLFPLVLPIAFLIVVGLKNFFDCLSKDKDVGSSAIKIFILFEFVFFNYVVWNDIIPVFHIILKSPHPGV